LFNLKEAKNENQNSLFIQQIQTKSQLKKKIKKSSESVLNHHVRSCGWVAVTKKRVNLILDLEEGDFW
jgi:hypothetical protein